MAGAGALRVMVVDDLADHAETLAEVLQLCGHDARPFPSGPDALAALAGFAPDACFLDLRMKPMDGYALAAALRDRLGPGVRLFALTGERDAAADPRSAVFDRVFTKPPRLDDLLMALAAGR
jgi:CheY-like chemotaxis protein